VPAKLIDEFRVPRRSILTMANVVPCDVRWLRAEAAVVDALARLQLAALRGGWQISLRNASPELLELIAFIGLEQALPRDEDRSASH
jgi:hypothetical protein